MNLQDLRYWWEDLELRKKLEENQSLVIICLLAVILISLGLVTCQMVGGRQGSFSQEVDLVYYDLTNQTIKIVRHQFPEPPRSPLQGTDDVFMAYVYSCEECPEGKLKDGMTPEELKANGMFIAWLERTDPTVSEDEMEFGLGQQLRTLENERWFKPMDPGYDQIMTAFHKRCERPFICLP